MLSKIEKEKIQKLKEEISQSNSRLCQVIDNKNLLAKELEVLKEEKNKQLKEFNARCAFVEGLLSHMLAKQIKVIHPDGAEEIRWQPVSSLVHEMPHHTREKY